METAFITEDTLPSIIQTSYSILLTLLSRILEVTQDLPEDLKQMVHAEGKTTPAPVKETTTETKKEEKEEKEEEALAGLRLLF